MFLTKAGQIGKALCAEYKKSEAVKSVLSLFEADYFGVAFSYDKDNETIVYEAFSKDSTPNESHYVYLEVQGDGKPIERFDKSSALVGLHPEQKALYIYLFEKEMSLSMNELAEKTTTVNSLLQSIMDQVGGVTSQITQIATAAEEQTTATSEISANMQGITDISQSFSNEVRNANVEVNKSIELLEDLVHKVESIRV